MKHSPSPRAPHRAFPARLEPARDRQGARAFGRHGDPRSRGCGARRRQGYRPQAAIEAAGEGFGHRLCAIRLNGIESAEHAADVAAVAGSAADFAVLPQGRSAQPMPRRWHRRWASRVLAMIETPLGVLAAAEIAAVPGVAGLLAGTNDSRQHARHPPGRGPGGLMLALQTIVLRRARAEAGRSTACSMRSTTLKRWRRNAARAAALGFDGKSLIHPNQLDIAALPSVPPSRTRRRPRADRSRHRRRRDASATA
jgi:citrate lyase subunit beta/citryl-CoA lyase